MRRTTTLQANIQPRQTLKLRLDKRMIGAVLFGCIPALMLILTHYGI